MYLKPPPEMKLSENHILHCIKPFVGLRHCRILQIIINISLHGDMIPFAEFCKYQLQKFNYATASRAEFCKYATGGWRRPSYSEACSRMVSGEPRALMRHRELQRATRWRTEVVALLPHRHRGCLRRTGALIAQCKGYNAGREEGARGPKRSGNPCKI